MAKDSRNSPSTPRAHSDKPKKSAAQVKSEIVTRARKIVRRSVARLQAAEVRTSGNPAGNWELLKAWKAFDEQLVALVNGAAPEAETAK